MDGVFKLARVGGGKGHYAEVAVRLAESPPSSVKLPSEEVRVWDTAALAGCAAALLYVRPGKRLYLEEILRIGETAIDTSEHAVWCASFLATFDALGVECRGPVYDKAREEWRVELSDGTKVGMSQ